MDIIALLIGFAAGALIAIVAFVLVRKAILKGKRDEILEKAELEAEKIKNDKILQAKERILQLKSEHEQVVNEKNAALREAESRIKQKENSVGQLNNELLRKNKEAEQLRASLKGQQDALTRKAEEYEPRLVGKALRS